MINADLYLHLKLVFSELTKDDLHFHKLIDKNWWCILLSKIYSNTALLVISLNIQNETLENNLKPKRFKNIGMHILVYLYILLNSCSIARVADSICQCVCFFYVTFFSSKAVSEIRNGVDWLKAVRNYDINMWLHIYLDFIYSYIHSKKINCADVQLNSPSSSLKYLIRTSIFPVGRRSSCKIQ